MANKKAEFAVQILKQYQEETQNGFRTTSDISPLEEWLIIKLYEANDTINQLQKFSNDREQ